MKNNIILIAGAMVAAVAIGELVAQPAFSQDHGQQSQYQGDHGPGDRFDEIYRQGYRAGYTAARHNQRYDDRRDNNRYDDHHDNRDYQGQQR